MKVCLFNTAKVWGGGEKWHLDMAITLKNAGHDVTIASYQNSELICRAKHNDIPTKGLKLSNISFLNPVIFFRLYHYFRKNNFDVVIFNFSTDLKNAAYPAKRAKVPRIIYRRGSAIPIKNSAINRFIFGQCLSDILANSEATKRTILQNNPHLFPEEKIHVIYNGIKLDAFNGIQESPHNEIPVIGNLGRCVYQKGQDILLEVAAILQKRNVCGRFSIGGDGILLGKLKQQATDLGVSDIVTFEGFINDPAKFLETIDIFALPSRWEGFGYVIAEAMACKKPVVAFDISSNPELIIDNETGYLTPFNDVASFADALEKLLSNKEVCTRFGDKGQQRALTKFDSRKNLSEALMYIEQSPR